MTLQEIVDQLKSCGYVCEAGPLENNEAFRALERATMTGLSGSFDGKTDNRQVLISFDEYGDLLAIAEACKGLRNELSDLLSSLNSLPKGDE